MKPRVICLMAASIDGRTLQSRWRPKGGGDGDMFERAHEELAGDAWLIGRITGQEFAKGKPYPASVRETFPREPWFARRDAKAYGVVLDAHGKIAWGRSGIDPTGYHIDDHQMPWRAIGKMDDEELGAIYEYLTHLPDNPNVTDSEQRG